MRSKESQENESRKSNIGYTFVPSHEKGSKPDSPGVPWQINPWRLCNISIPLSYFCVGVGMTFISTPLTYYCVDDLNATAAQQNIIATVMSLPWAFKLVYGFLSDCLPIFGMRRKPYFFIGWSVYICCNLFLALLGSPSVQWIVLLIFLQTVGYMCADVMTDTMVVERSKAFESEEDRGSFQAIGYTVRTFGTIVGSVMGACLYNHESWGWGLSIDQIFLLNALIPTVVVAPFISSLVETNIGVMPRKVRDQWNDIFEVLQKRAVWQPCSFVFFYNTCQISNAAWSNFLILGLGFSDWNLGVLSVFSSIFSWTGIVVYKRYFFKSSWRAIYIWTTSLSAFFSLLQMALIFGINRVCGIPDVMFAAGDSAIWSFVLYIQFLPMCIMYIAMCPDGSEGATYAMLTTLSNMAGTVAYDISTELTRIWDVSNNAIESGDMDGMWKLTLLTSLVQIAPLPFLFLIPKNKEDQMRLQKSPEKNYWCGVAFVVVLGVSLTATVIESIWEIYA